VHGHGGLDELTTSGPNRLSYLKDGRVTTFDLDATELGLRPARVEDLHGGDPVLNAQMLRRLLAGEDESTRRDVVLLNAAAALALEDGDFCRGLAAAESSLSSGAPLRKLDALIAASQLFATPAPLL
jgi:anthranilate phosphoribosyltransferase